MNTILSSLLWCVVQVTVLGIGAALVYLAARRFHPRAGAVAVSGALGIVLLLTALVASPWPRWSISRSEAQVARSEPAAPRATPVESSEDDVAAVEETSAATALPPGDLESPQFAFWTALVDGLNNPRAAVDAKPQAAWWPRTIGVMFIFGALIAAGRLAWGVVLVRRLARRAISINDPRLHRTVRELQAKLELTGPIALCESNELATPATVGWRRPIVLLPPSWRTWTDEELRAAVAHELAHVAGRDYAAWLVARLAVVAHFYHPLVRWLAQRLQLEQELAADLAAARLVGDNRQYLHSLAALALATPPHRVAGPVRTLIPTRSLLVRRVEMLRTSEMNRPRRNVVRYATFAIVALLGLGAAGLRGPGSDGGNVALAQAPDASGAKAEEAVERIGLEVVPQDVTFVVSIRPAQLAANKEFSPIVKLLDETAPLNQFGLNSQDIAEFMFIKYGKDSVSGRFAIRFVDAERLQQYVNKLGPGFKKGLYANVRRSNTQIVIERDPTTLVIDHTQTIPEDKLPPLTNPQPRWAEAWQERKDQSIVAAVDIPGLRAFRPEAKNLAGGVPLQMVAPLFDHTDFALATVEFQNNIGIFATLKCDSEESAKSVSETVQALMVLLKNIAGEQAAVEQAAAQRPDANRTQLAVVKMIKAAQEVLDRAEVKVEGDRVRLALRSELTIDEISNLAISVEEARKAARQTQSMNNLKQLALAMLNYESAYGTYPPAISYTYRKDGQLLKSEHPHSWRVAILPFLEEQALYNEYRFDEPWDSEANKKIMATVVPVFRSPFDDPSPTNTSYFVLTGPGTIFDGEKGARIVDIRDGTSKTFMIVEAKRPVPWTKPEDIPYATDAPVPQLGGWVPGQFQAASADGAAHQVSSDIDEAALRLWIGINDRERSPELPRKQ